MTLINCAKHLVNMGFHVFPLTPNGKKPIIDNFTDNAITVAQDIDRFWFDPVMELGQPYNIGVATTRYNGGTGSLLVVDVDMKKGKNGLASVNKLEMNGFDFPPTLTQRTPTGGFHYIYKTPQPVKQGTNVLGKGLDIRSRGGYFVGAGSTIDDKSYSFVDGNVAIVEAPQWIVDKCGETTKKRESKTKNTKPDTKAGIDRVIDFLKRAKPAIEGDCGDERTFKVATRCKDLGVSEGKCCELMFEHWNPRCVPPWSAEQLQEKVANAYIYGQNDIGVDAPEAQFEEAEIPTDTVSPVLEYNKEFAFVVIGGKSTIIRKMPDGQFDYINVASFHDLKRADDMYVDGKGWQKTSDVWMESKLRATYNRIGLYPEKETPADVLNLWRGFSCKPLAHDEEPTPEMLEGVKMFQEHAFQNVCASSGPLYTWLMGYFAHMVQRPWEKPLTALVFKGEKGVGKNALIDRIGNLVSHHYLLTSSKRYVISNFNRHIANLLLFVLDEAFWSGDKQAEGILKDLITGNKHLIEQKGREMYTADNITRIVIIGNEEWLVPATQDERRFAVFNVGNARMKDRKFFSRMRHCLDNYGGNRLMLRQLMDFDLSKVEVDAAPETPGLLDQKIESLSPIHAWWYGSLQEGEILNVEFPNLDKPWPSEIGREALRTAFLAYAKQRHIRSWLPDAASFGRMLKKACPDLDSSRRGNKGRARCYIVPTLQVARLRFEVFIGHSVEWEDDEQPSNVIEASRLFQ